MGGIWFNPGVLADSLSETVGYKAGLALSISQICDHLDDPKYPDLILASEEQVVRLRSEDYEALFYKLLHSVGYIEKQYDGGNAFTQLFHMYRNTHFDELTGVLKIFNEMWPKLLDQAALKGEKTIEPMPFLDACLDRYGKLGLQMATESVMLINQALHVSPYSPVRYVDWKKVEQLDLLFDRGAEEPEQGEFIDQRFIDYLSNNPDKLATMHWRKFEELTAEFFFRAGFQIELGPGQNDDGIDIRVWKPGQDKSNPPYCIVQCKRQKKKIEKVIVKGLYSDVQFADANYGLIVTSSELSKGARQTISVRGYPIAEVNKTGLTTWLMQLRTPGTGIVRV